MDGQSLGSRRSSCNSTEVVIDDEAGDKRDFTPFDFEDTSYESDDTDRLLDGIVPTTDDISAPSFTFRVLVMGTFWCIFLGAVNAIFTFRTNSFAIPSFLSTLLTYPMGVFLSKILPYDQYRTYGFRWT